MSEQELQRLENQFPTLSSEAFSAARKRVLDAGQPVLQSEGGFLIRVFPDGRKEILKELPPSFHVQAGTRLSIP